jgi:hypothetical protein
MNDRHLKMIQVAIDAGILVCLLIILPTAMKVGHYAELDSFHVAQGFAVRVVNDEGNPTPVKIQTEVVKKGGDYQHQYFGPIPVKIYTGLDGVDENGNIVEKYDIPIPVRTK